MAERKLLRKKRDGTGYEGISLREGGATHDPTLTEDTARHMWAEGGFDEVDDAEFEAARRIAYGQPDTAAEDFRAGAEKAATASTRKPGPAAWAEDDFRAGAGKVGRTEDPSDAKLDGLSNPAARPAQDWVDAPKAPMPPAGRKAQPRIAVGMPAKGREVSQGAVAAEASRQPALGRKSPLVASYMARRFGAEKDPLATARSSANRNRLGVQLARAGAMANESLSGARYDRGAYDELDAQSQEPLVDFEARRKMGQEDAEASARGDERRLRAEDTQRRWGADERDFTYRQGRDAEGDKLARERLAADERQATQQRGLQWASLQEQRAARTSSEQARRDDRRDAAQAKETQMRERQDEKDMAELGKRTDKLAQVKADVETVNKMLANGGDIPGAGVWDSFKMDNAFTRALFASKDDVESWQAGQRMVANYLSTMTGQSFTLPEAERTLQRYGVRTGSTEDEWKLGMTAFIRDAKSGLVQKEAPFKHVVPEMRRRGGTTAEDIPAPAGSPTGKLIHMPNGQVYEVLSNGKARPRG